MSECKKNMKVAILSNLFPPNSRGGAEEAARNQANTFCVQGNEVIILTLSPLNKKSVQTRDGIKIYELPHRNIFNYFNIGKHSAPLRFLWHIIDVFNLWLANDIGKILKAEKPDLVITHNLKGLSLLVPLKIKKLEIKNYQVMHDVSLYTPSGLIVYGKENIFEHTGFLTMGYRFFTRWLFRYANKVFFPSAWLLNFYRQNEFFINQEKIYQSNKAGFKIPPTPPFPKRGDINIPAPFPRGEEGNLSLYKREGRKGFLYVGQLEPHKGILFLLDVFFLLFSSPYVMGGEEGLKLHIVGDGSLLPEIKKRAEANPNIIIHGRVERERLPEFYSRAKAVIFPSMAYENAPMVIAESLSCGAPVISSRLGGAPEIIREGVNGATFTPGDAADLAKKIKMFL